MTAVEKLSILYTKALRKQEFDIHELAAAKVWGIFPKLKRAAKKGKAEYRIYAYG